MRIGLLTDGGYPYATGESRLWCDRLVRGLAQHEFDIYALSRGARQESRGWVQLPRSVGRVRAAPLWSRQGEGRPYGRRERRRFAGHFGDLVSAVRAQDGAATGPDTRGGSQGSSLALAFAEGLAEPAGDHGGPATAPRSEAAVRILEAACHAPGARRSARGATVPGYLAFADRLGRTPHPESPRRESTHRDAATRVALAHERSAGGPTPRRGPAGPVRTFIHSHRELCERAVDPLEIAAGLGAHGVTDRVAARFRHRYVFSLAEGLYARVPRAADRTDATDRTDPADPADPAPPYPARAASPRAGWASRTLLPGAVCALTVTAPRLTGGATEGVRHAIGVAGALALALAPAVALRHGPLRVAGHTAPVSGLWLCWLSACALYGDGLLDHLTGAGPYHFTPLVHVWAPLVALAFGVAPAAWCAHLFPVQARRGLTGSRGLAEFASGTRPPLLGLLALYGAVLTGLVTACAAGALALAAAAVGRIPGCELLATPVRAAVDAWGAGPVPAVACGAAALGLLIHRAAALPRASAHTS